MTHGFFNLHLYKNVRDTYFRQYKKSLLVISYYYPHSEGYKFCWRWFYAKSIILVLTNKVFWSIIELTWNKATSIWFTIMSSYLDSELLRKTFSSLLYSYLFLYSSINISFANERFPAKNNKADSLLEQIEPLENNRLKKIRNLKKIDDTSSRKIQLKDLDNIIQ